MITLFVVLTEKRAVEYVIPKILVLRVSFEHILLFIGMTNSEVTQRRKQIYYLFIKYNIIIRIYFLS